MKLGAYQAPLLPAGSTTDAVVLIAEQVARCEAAGIDILCCPEGILGGLADYAPQPEAIALDVEGGQLADVLAPIASRTVTTIIGFTEIDRRGRLFNTAVVWHNGTIAGLYRKVHPAIRRSVYEAGTALPVFTIDALTFGIVICYDSRFPEPVRAMAAAGARVIFVPTNNGLPPAKTYAGLPADVTRTDVARATENRVWVIRADVAGETDGLIAPGSSEIVDPDGRVVESARQFTTGLIVTEMPAVEAGRTDDAAEA